MSTHPQSASAQAPDLPPMGSRRVVLLVGSARPRGQSTSEALGRALLIRMEALGFESEIFWVARTRGEQLAELCDAIDGADVFVLVTPLYVDSLPHLVTAALEHIARRRQLTAGLRPCRFAAIVNCGFPEAAHTRLAQEICRLFAGAAGLHCAGTLGLGGGESIGGRPPDRMGWFTRHVTRALDLMAEALAAGRPIPPKAAELMARPLIPARGYTIIGEMGWRRAARRNGAEHLLDARPYPPAPPLDAGGPSPEVTAGLAQPPRATPPHAG